MIVYHYTTAHKWPLIRHAQRIELARGKLDVRERPAAWFSARDDYEPTAVKALLNPATGARMTMTIDQTERAAGGLVRIGVEQRVSAPHDWVAFQALSGCSRLWIRELIRSARVMGGDPLEWYVSFSPVPASEWLHVELRDARTKRWHPIGG